MKLLNLRKQLKNDFRTSGIEETDVDFIASEVLGVPKTELVFIDEITNGKAKQILKFANMRRRRKPIDKIFKRSYFYGLEFKVDGNVLSPRQDSELLVDTALRYIKQNNYKTGLDLCTGSGCLAVAIKAKADIDLLATDVSQKALRIARRNAKQNKTKIKFKKSNMFDGVKGKFDIIISNPPYIETEELKFLEDEVVKFDPTLALDGGKDGLKFYNIIHNKVDEFLNPNGMLILEIGNTQKEKMINLFDNLKYVETLKDYGGNDRVVVFKNKRSSHDRKTKSN